MKTQKTPAQIVFFTATIISIFLSTFFLLIEPKYGNLKKVEDIISDSLILSIISIISFTIGNSIISLEKYIYKRDEILKNIDVLPKSKNIEYIRKIIEKVVNIENMDKNIIFRKNEEEQQLKKILKTLERIEKMSFPANIIERTKFISKKLKTSEGTCYALGCEDLMDWWNTNSGKEYWHINKEFLSKKGNNIKRYHIIDNEIKDYIEGSKKDCLELLEKWYIKQKILMDFDEEGNSYIEIYERKFIDNKIYNNGIDPKTSFLLIKDNFCSSANLFSDCYSDCDGGISYDREIINEYIELFSNITKSGESTSELKDWKSKMNEIYEKEKNNIKI